MTDNGTGDEDATAGVIKDPVGLGQVLSSSTSLANTGDHTSIAPIIASITAMLAITFVARRKIAYKYAKK